MAISFSNPFARRQETLDDNQVATLRRLLDTPVVQNALAEEEGAVQARRVQLVAELKAIDTAAGRHSNELTKAAERHQKTINRIKDELREAEAALGVVVAEIFAQPIQTGALVKPLEEELRELAPSVIDDFLEELREYQAKLKRIDPVDVTIGGVYLATEALGQSIETLGLLFKEARALKLAPFSDERIEERLAELRRELPSLLELRSELQPEHRDGNVVRR